MSSWQSSKRVLRREALTIATTERDIHNCGNSACFAGYVAVSPEFQADGGSVSVNYNGAPMIGDVLGTYAIIEWLGLSVVYQPFINDMINGGLEPNYEGGQWPQDGHSHLFCSFYGKRWGDVNSDDVIAKLRELQQILINDLRRSRIMACVNIMNRVRFLDMSSRRSVGCDTLAIHHHSSFAGHVAVSPEFKADGGYACPTLGHPVYPVYDRTMVGVEAIAAWLMVDYQKVQSIEYGDLDMSDHVDMLDHTTIQLDNVHSKFYNKPRGEINISDVVQKLKALLKEYEL